MKQLCVSSLHPGDLHPFTRRPFFLVVDSDNSSAFKTIPKLFDQPLVVLMSPQETPASFQGKPDVATNCVTGAVHPAVVKLVSMPVCS